MGSKRPNLNPKKPCVPISRVAEVFDICITNIGRSGAQLYNKCETMAVSNMNDDHLVLPLSRYCLPFKRVKEEYAKITFSSIQKASQCSLFLSLSISFSVLSLTVSLWRMYLYLGFFIANSRPM